MNKFDEQFKAFVALVEAYLDRATENPEIRPTPSDKNQQQQGETIDKAQILERVAQEFGLTCEMLLGRGRTQHVSLARHVAMYLMRVHTQMSLPQIGDIFNRDHTTALHGYRLIQRRVLANPGFIAKMEEDILRPRVSEFEKACLA